ncbi:MAG: CoA transferase, partial [Dehalococcoidia bacterium]
MSPQDQPLPLAGYRVLDLTLEAGHLAGKLLADLGCQVIKVEPPGGDPARRKEPWAPAGSPNRTGLFWLAYNTGKLGITLNTRTAAGRFLLERLAEQSDFLVESYAPGQAAGVDYARLVELNPRLVMASITPFGEGGPYQDYRDGELIAQAAGGLLFLSGADESRPPVRLGVEMAWHMAAAQAVAAMLIAHQHRSATGRGQHIDLSAQEAVTN